MLFGNGWGPEVSENPQPSWVPSLVNWGSRAHTWSALLSLGWPLSLCVHWPGCAPGPWWEDPFPGMVLEFPDALVDPRGCGCGVVPESLSFGSLWELLPPLWTASLVFFFFFAFVKDALSSILGEFLLILFFFNFYWSIVGLWCCVV